MHGGGKGISGSKRPEALVDDRRWARFRRVSHSRDSIAGFCAWYGTRRKSICRLVKFDLRFYRVNSTPPKARSLRSAARSHDEVVLLITLELSVFYYDCLSTHRRNTKAAKGKTHKAECVLKDVAYATI